LCDPSGSDEPIDGARSVSELLRGNLGSGSMAAPEFRRS
jgi:hypothetical protein